MAKEKFKISISKNCLPIYAKTITIICSDRQNKTIQKVKEKLDWLCTLHPEFSDIENIISLDEKSINCYDSELDEKIAEIKL